MKVKSLYFVLSVLVVLLTSACSNGDTGSGSQSELNEPYRLALDEIISTDVALNENMEYISLNFDKELPLKDSDKQSIEEYLQHKYKVKIYNLTYEQLVEKGLFTQDASTLKGILLSIENHEQLDQKNNFTIEVSKYRSNEGAISAKITLSYREGQWKVVTYTPTKEG